jgi:hypothetical protein
MPQHVRQSRQGLRGTYVLALNCILLGQRHDFNPHTAEIAQCRESHLCPPQIAVVSIRVADQDNVLGAMQ